MTTFSVWAPHARSVDLWLAGPGVTDAIDLREPHSRTHGETLPLQPIPLQPVSPARPARPGDGWWQLDVPAAGHGTDYAFSLDGGPLTPDPRSRWQPHGVHGPSRVYDDARFAWGDHQWTGRDVRGHVIYELHVGTFTGQRDFDGVATRLDHLVDLGVDAVELLPVAAFDGRHGWGYDGVDLWAVHEPYGGPDGLKRLVDACHRAGLAVLLDVVYNHLGPSGNYLDRFGPYFTDRYRTPWGQAVNLDGPGSDEVRGWIIDNALMWLTCYHLDGLRLDAVHELHDERAQPLLGELTAEVDALAGRLGRPLTVIAESDRNDPRTITPRLAGGLGLHAQWDDDVHHALHAMLTGERQGYYVDFGSVATTRHALTHGFVHDGTWSTFRARHHGAPLDRRHTSGHQLVACVSDHDQVGNRAVGDRPAASMPPGRALIGAGLLLTSAFTPMLFMGEEWAASSPWLYFTDHPDPQLAAAVRQGRRAEFAAHGWTAEEIPDPQDPATLAASTLDWAEPAQAPHNRVLAAYRALLAARRVEPDLTDPRLDRVVVEGADLTGHAEPAGPVGPAERGAGVGGWIVVRRGRLRVLANWSTLDQVLPVDRPVVQLIVDTAALLGTGQARIDTPDDPTSVRVPPDGLVIARVS